MEFWLVLWIACGVLSAIAANTKGRSVPAWALIGFATGIFGLIAILILPAIPSEPQQR